MGSWLQGPAHRRSPFREHHKGFLEGSGDICAQGPQLQQGAWGQMAIPHIANHVPGLRTERRAREGPACEQSSLMLAGKRGLLAVKTVLWTKVYPT